MIEDIFEQYKEMNFKIIKSIKEDKEDVKLIEEREKIIKQIIDSNLDKNEVLRIYKDMNLEELDKELEKILKDKMEIVKISIKKLAAGKAVTKSYAAVNRSGNFFGTKV